MNLSHIKNLSKDTFFYSLPRVLPALGFFILTPIYTAYLSPADYGVLALLMVLGQALSILMMLNMNTGVLRFYYDYQGEEKKRFLGTIAVGSFFFSGVICIALLLAGSQLTRIIFKSEAITFWPLVSSEILTVFLGIAAIVPAAVLKNERKSKEWSAIQIGTWIFTTALGIYFIVWLKDGAWGKIKSQLIGAAVLFVIYWIITLRHARIYFSFRIFWMNLVFGLPILGKSISAYIYQFSDRWIMERNVPMDHIGFFSLGDSFSRVPQMGQAAFADAWMPYFFGEASKDKESASFMIREISHYWAVMMATLTLAFCLFINPLVSLLANIRFQNAIVISSAKLLIVAYFLASLQIFFMYALSFAKNNTPILTTTIIAAIVNLAINILYIPQFGVLTAGWARIAAYLLNLTLLYYAAQKVFFVQYKLKEFFKLLFIGTCAFVLSLLLETSSLYLNIVKDIFIFGIYIVVLFYLDLIEYSKLITLLRNQIFTRRGEKTDA